MQHVHVDRREKSRPGATYGQYFVSWKRPAAVLVRDPKYRPFGVESGVTLLLEELHITLYLENCGPLFSQVRISLSPRAHISQGP